MKKTLKKTIIHSRFSRSPENIAHLMKDSEKLRVPEKLVRQAADIMLTVEENILRGGEKFDPAPIVASHILKYAYLLNQRGELIEEEKANPKKATTPKTEAKKPDKAHESLVLGLFY